jgi:hypothetical protein
MEKPCEQNVSPESFRKYVENVSNKRAFESHLKKHGSVALFSFWKHSNDYEDSYPNIAPIKKEIHSEEEFKCAIKNEQLLKLSGLYNELVNKEIPSVLQWDENSVKKLKDSVKKITSFRKLLQLTGSNESVTASDLAHLSDWIFFLNRQVETVLIYHHFKNFQERLALYGIRKTESAPTRRNSLDFEDTKDEPAQSENNIFRSVSSNSDGKAFSPILFRRDATDHIKVAISSEPKRKERTIFETEYRFPLSLQSKEFESIANDK